MPNMILFLCFFLRAISISVFIIWENECLLRMSILTLFIKVMRFEVIVLCFGNCSDAKNGLTRSPLLKA